jgi:hypothetical protein
VAINTSTGAAASEGGVFTGDVRPLRRDMNIITLMELQIDIVSKAKNSHAHVCWKTF